MVLASRWIDFDSSDIIILLKPLLSCCALLIEIFFVGFWRFRNWYDWAQDRGEWCSMSMSANQCFIVSICKILLLINAFFIRKQVWLVLPTKPWGSQLPHVILAILPYQNEVGHLDWMEFARIVAERQTAKAELSVIDVKPRSMFHVSSLPLMMSQQNGSVPPAMN